MKPSALLLSTILFLLFSCQEKKSPETRIEETPAALQEKRPSSMKRGPGDLVEGLYEELVQKNFELEKLETQINNFHSRKPDSLEAFGKYNNKSLNYYNSAASHYEDIRDSVIKERIKSLILASQSAYNTKTSGTTSLIAQIENRATTLNDLHIVLKLSSTLPLIEKYQTDNLPSSDPVKSILKDVERLIWKTDSLSKK